MIHCLCDLHGNCSDAEETQRSLATARKMRDLQRENHLLNVLLLKQHTLSRWRLGYHRVNHGKEVRITASSSILFIMRPSLRGLIKCCTVSVSPSVHLPSVLCLRFSRSRKGRRNL